MEAIDLKPGMVIDVDGAIYTVISAVHTHAQQRRAVVRVKVKELKTGKTNEFVWRSDTRVNQVIVEEVPLVYLYADASGYHFMDVATFEQILLSPDIVGDTKFYLKENLEVTGLVHDGRILDIKVPIFIEARVVETEPGFKGDTVQAAKKPAKLETGLTILVPLFINSGDTIKLDTRTNEYITRV